MFDLLHYFTDPVLRGPVLGTMLMCITSSIVGVIVYLQKKALVGETLSHAAYPGIVLGLILSLKFEGSPLIVMTGGVITGSLALLCLNQLTTRFSVKSDSALCMVLASFFGLGILLISILQLTHGGVYKQAESYIYGQAALMGDRHILLYLLLTAIVSLSIILFYKQLQTYLFDATYAKSQEMPTKFLSALIFFLIVLSVVTGIRSVGVILMSAMLLSPAVAARQFVNKLSHLFILAAIFGLLSALIGNILSNEITTRLSSEGIKSRLVLPTGPMIVLVSAAFTFLAITFAPKKGLFVRALRIFSFQLRCAKENLLKVLWRNKNQATKDQLSSYLSLSPLIITALLTYLKYQGWIKKEKEFYSLTEEGEVKAAHIVRLHRLWEVYLVDYIGVNAQEVHAMAEEMEHILTPELERELTLLLLDPKWDPHHQPIPPINGGLS